MAILIIKIEFEIDLEMGYDMTTTLLLLLNVVTVAALGVVTVAALGFTAGYASALENTKRYYNDK